MRPPLLALSLFLLLVLQQQHKKTQAAQQPAQQEQRGTQDSPFVVKVLPTPKSTQETEAEAQDREKKAATDRNLVNATWVLAAIGVLQLIVFGLQAAMLRQTVDASVGQSESMERHIAEAARSATAMENIAATIQVGNEAIMRAYLTVTIGTALFQERREGQADLKFEVRANLVNTGNTHARKVRMRKKADILPNPLPDGFEFPLPDPPHDDGDMTVGAHLNYIVGSTVDDFVVDAEVAAIKEGNGKVLHSWGLITYEDIFGKPHWTKFGQMITWQPDGSIMGYYLPSQNDTD